MDNNSCYTIFSYSKYSSIKYMKCEEKDHIMTNCISKKINWLEDTVKLLQILKRQFKQPKKIELVTFLK